MFFLALSNLFEDVGLGLGSVGWMWRKGWARVEHGDGFVRWGWGWLLLWLVKGGGGGMPMGHFNKHRTKAPLLVKEKRGVRGDKRLMLCFFL